jgi:flagellar basal-body rod protein FlgB
MSEQSPTVSPAAALDLAQLALRLEHVNARLHAENVARFGAGSATQFGSNLEQAYAALQPAAGSPASARALLSSATQDLQGFAGVREVPLPADASLDDLLMAMTRTASRYQSLADGVSRQLGLMQLAIRGAR